MRLQVLHFVSVSWYAKCEVQVCNTCMSECLLRLLLLSICSFHYRLDNMIPIMSVASQVAVPAIPSDGDPAGKVAAC